MKATRRLGIGSNRNLRILLLALVAIGATAFGVLGYGASLLQSLEGSTINTRFTVRGTQAVPKNLMVVAIDPRSFQDLNKQFPFPRKVDGKAISTISAQHPAAIAVDVQLSEPSSLGQDDDIALLSAVNDAHGKAIFSDTEPTATGNVAFVGSAKGTALLKSVGARPAEGSFPFDPGGVIRQMQYKISGPQNARGRDRRSRDAQARHPVYGQQVHRLRRARRARSPTSPSPRRTGARTAARKTGKKLPKNFFTNKIVVIGATATNLNDIHPSSTDSAMPGPEIQANAIYTVLHNFPLRAAAGWVNVLLILLLGLTVPLVGMRARPLFTILLAVALGVAFTVGVQLAFNSGSIVTFVYPLGALILATAGTLTTQLVTEAFERIRTRDLFTRFVPEDVVDEVLQELRRPASRRRPARGHRHVLGPSRVHLDGGVAHPGARDRGPQPLSQRDERRHPQPRRHARRLHGRRDHGRVRRAAPTGGPRRPWARGSARDARRPVAAVQRVAARRGSPKASAWASG